MPKARLHLIVCSDDIGPEARRRRSDRSYRPSVIDGGKRAIAVPAGYRGKRGLNCSILVFWFPGQIILPSSQRA